MIQFIGMRCNKYGVPYRRFVLELVDGRRVVMDIGYEDDWGSVQHCMPEDCKDWRTSVGWGDDVDGHVKIRTVFDADSGRVWTPFVWAEQFVWCWNQLYGG